MSQTWTEMWVDNCNNIGNWTNIRVSNYTSHTVKLQLQIAGVTYRETVVDPIDSELYNPTIKDIVENKVFLENGLSNAILECGYAWYSIRATVCGTSAVTEGYVEICPAYMLHFVYGGSKVAIVSHTGSPSRIILYNLSAAENNYHSQNFQEVVDMASESVRGAVEKVDSAKETLKDSFRRKFSSQSRNSEGEYGSTFYKPVSHDSNSISKSTIHSWSTAEKEEPREEVLYEQVSSPRRYCDDSL